MPTPIPGYQLRDARESDIPSIHALMREMAEFEKLTDIFKATPDSLRTSFFGPEPAAHGLVIAPDSSPDTAIAYIMWFHNYSSFLDRRGLYLEDVYITPAHRGRGLGGWVLNGQPRPRSRYDCHLIDQPLHHRLQRGQTW
ncbi:hypothetical protein CDEF62S_04400 [Castellaniella defragrans]